MPAAAQVAIAKYWAAQGGQDVLHAAHHLHGGVGVDRDYPLYRYFLLAKQLELDLGSATPSLVHLGALFADTPVALDPTTPGWVTWARGSRGTSPPSRRLRSPSGWSGRR